MERGSDLDVLKDQYIFTSMASDYPLPHYITVISLYLYCNSVQGQTVSSVACLLEVTWKPLMLTILMDMDWWGVIKCSHMSAECDHIWPEQDEEDLMALDELHASSLLSTFSCAGASDLRWQLFFYFLVNLLNAELHIAKWSCQTAQCMTMRMCLIIACRLLAASLLYHHTATYVGYFCTDSTCYP